MRSTSRTALSVRKSVGSRRKAERGKISGGGGAERKENAVRVSKGPKTPRILLHLQWDPRHPFLALSFPFRSFGFLMSKSNTDLSGLRVSSPSLLSGQKKYRTITKEMLKKVKNRVENLIHESFRRFPSPAHPSSGGPYHYH